VTGFAPVQTPAWQVSVCVQALPSLHDVPLATTPSAGQDADVPVQLSATSHCPVEARHTVADGLNPSAGQEVEVPVQLSATSHVPAAARHTAPAFPTGCWQVTSVPLQVSAVQGLPSSVQAVPLAFLLSPGQVALLPLQVSAASQSPAAARQTVEDGWNPSAGQAMDVPLQVSATSQAPAEARQTVPLGQAVQVPRCAAWLQAPQLPPLQAVSQQMPLTQNPEPHWLFVVHPIPNDASYR